VRARGERQAVTRKQTAGNGVKAGPATKSARTKASLVAIAAEVSPGDGTSGQLGRVIANHVRSRRLEIGLNVGQLAERTGISKGMLSKIENAQTSPSLSTLERLSSALDMPVTSLFRGLAEERAIPTNCWARCAVPTDGSSPCSCL
jgi:ribosome-binding protein aMBF1 (putative translation factor)